MNPASPSLSKDTLEHFAILGMQTASMLHEVNNKLTVISGMLDLFALDDLAPRCRDRCGYMAKAQAGIVALVREASDLAAGRMDEFLKSESVTTEDLVERLRDVVQPISAMGTSGLEVSCDPRKTVRALADVVRNALQAGANQVTLDIGWNDGLAIVRIVDDGPGIPREIAERLFTPGTTHGKANGQGIGLFSARWILEAMGGSLRLERSDSRGTCFLVTLPLTNRDA